MWVQDLARRDRAHIPTASPTLHFKDTETKYLGHTGSTPARELYRKVMLYKNLGSGGVDFRAILKILRQRGYDGWITLDLDPPRPGAGTIE